MDIMVPWKFVGIWSSLWLICFAHSLAQKTVSNAHPGVNYGDKEENVLLAAGVAKSGLLFDGRNDYALVRNFRNLPETRITVAAWIKVYKHKSFSRILSHEWIGWGWNLYTDGTGIVRFGIGQDNKDFAAGRIIFRDKWHYVVGRYDGEYLQVFVDGKSGARTTLPNATIDNSGFVSIGGAEYDPFIGEMDDVRIYNISLSDEEITKSMTTPPTGDEEGLVAYWKMDEAKGQKLHDLSKMENHAEMGVGKRKPLWIASGAPISIPCISAGESISLRLEGSSSQGEVQPFLVSLPDEQLGHLYQMDNNGTKTLIQSVPVELHNREKGANLHLLHYPAGSCHNMGHKQDPSRLSHKNTRV